MPDEFFAQNPPPQLTAPRRGGGRALVAGVLLAFVLGAAGVGTLFWSGVLPLDPVAKVSVATSSGAASPAASQAAAAAPSAEALARQDVLDARMAALEARLDSVDVHADAASGNAARAEALLIAFAARRALDRGAPLGFLEDQLRLRFGDAQPNAVATVIDAARSPVTLDQLLAGLDTLAPKLTAAPPSDSAWTRFERELASLFVIRRDSAPTPAPQVILGRARVLLEAGKTEDAINEVRRLPGAAAATDWMTAARGYETARRALDLLETAALLDTHGLKDSGGSKVEQPTPITPTPEASGSSV